MKNIVVVGSQWGDEGKGKIVELNETDSLFNSPKNKYTKALLKASDF